MPEPYYSDGAVTIYHGDIIEVLEAVTFTADAVITDPPYASGTRNATQRGSSGSMLRGARFADNPIMNDQMTTTGFVWLMRQVFLRCYPLIPDGASLLSFIDWRQWPNLTAVLETCNFRVQGMLVWDKGSIGMGNGFRVQHELICHASKGTPTVYDRGVGNVFRYPREEPVDHPSPKPQALMGRLLDVVTAPGDLILDPFMGSGTTLRAAKDHGRRCIGIESVEAHCETAAKRLGQGVLDLSA